MNYRYPKTVVTINGFSVTVPHRPPLHILERQGYVMTGEYRKPNRGESYWFDDEKRTYGGRVVPTAVNPTGHYFILRPICPEFKVRTVADKNFRDVSLTEVRDIICGCPLCK